MFNKSAISVAEIQNKILALNERRLIILKSASYYGGESLDSKKYKILTLLNTDFENASKLYEKVKSDKSYTNNLATYIYLTDIFFTILNIELDDLNIICTHRNSSTTFINAGLTFTGTLAGFALLGPIGGISSLVLMNSIVGENLKTKMGINTSSPKSAILIMDIMELCSKKMVQIAKINEQSKHQNNNIEMLFCKQDPFEFVTPQNMPKTTKELKDACFYICLTNNTMNVVFKNSEGNRCTFQSEININKKSLGAQLDMQSLYTIVIMNNLIKHLFQGQFIEHENENESRNELKS